MEQVTKSHPDRGNARKAEPPTFYFDLASPYSYLAAARIDDLLADVIWQPILVGALHKHYRRASWGVTPALRALGVSEIESRARAYRLPSFAWPDPYPANTLTAMRAAIFAQQRGRSREFARAAFSLAFGEGRDLTLLEWVLSATTQVGLDRSEVERALSGSALKEALRDANDEAIRRRVYGVPTIEIGDFVWWGDDQVEAAVMYASSL